MAQTYLSGQFFEFHTEPNHFKHDSSSHLKRPEIELEVIKRETDAMARRAVRFCQNAGGAPDFCHAAAQYLAYSLEHERVGQRLSVNVTVSRALQPALLVRIHDF